ncbi:hypothetical protein [Luteimonas sp. MC1750]|uniref:hypothetical protein n=1 Tax=Luteimonas sp. MC1750 TaxID=2799326 RepID=UPI0018F104E8|nr:hypothetical protein [Luteimonas sp. MC1750]MBJ6984022.1 hypothetical protein [Luteimonas sp. MC1750]QQO06834.1 hypothetical protein JGR68_05250 [Luteimonas sp. MC1750]
MRIKTSNTSTNLMLYTVLSLLFLAASQVDLDKMTTTAIDSQAASTDRFVDSYFR